MYSSCSHASWQLFFLRGSDQLLPDKSPAVTGRCFGEKDFRGGLENGILLCELLSSIRPGLVKKINRLPTPIAGLVKIQTYKTNLTFTSRNMCPMC
uniref:Calponin-homology (CH) domain-containing protein n=1 Tax=Pundamilia nyererei TaxID=303518 RepID=A0A3B4EV35_9CICH